jgi:nucleotide-binding universal stress UspA family protein
MTIAYPPAALSLKNILLATDLSPASETAFKFAQALARRHVSPLHAVYVQNEYSYQLLEPEPLNITFRELPEAAAHPTEALQKLFHGLPTQVPLRHGKVWEVLNEVIHRREIDLLVVGTHAREGLDRLVHGSVAEDVLRNAHCPVLTIGPDVKLSENGLTIDKILLATDFDSHSDSARYAAQLCNEFSAKLTLVHVSQELTDHDGADASLPRMGAGLVRKLMEETDLRFKPDSILEYGQPAAKILEVARKIRPDLIVLGARHPEPARINSHLPRPTIAKVVAQAECPVITVRQQD